MKKTDKDETVDQIKTRVVGIDIRLDKTTFGIVDVRGEIIAQDYFATSDYADVNDYVAVLAEKLLTLMEENGGYEYIRSVGISAPSASVSTTARMSARTVFAVDRFIDFSFPFLYSCK